MLLPMFNFFITSETMLNYEEGDQILPYDVFKDGSILLEFP